MNGTLSSGKTRVSGNSCRVFVRDYLVFFLINAHSRREVYNVRANLISVYVLPVCSDDALGDGVAYLVENVFVVRTADEELILKEQQTINEVVFCPAEWRNVCAGQ